MRVYIAADSYLQEEAKALRDVLVKNGIEVTSRWLDQKLEAFHPATETELQSHAHNNFSDIDRAVFLVAYNPISSHKHGTGGRHVEMGYALAKHKYVLYVGEAFENVFHYHVGVLHCVTFTPRFRMENVGMVVANKVKEIWEAGSQRISDR